MAKKRRRIFCKLAVLILFLAIMGACIFCSRTWYPLLGGYDSKPVELYMIENDPNAINLPLDHEIVQQVSSDVVFMYDYYLALADEDLETIESRWDQFQSDDIVSRILSYYSKELVVGDKACLITIKMLDKDHSKHLADMCSRMFSFNTIRNERDYAMARCGFITYGCGSGTLTWRGGVYNEKTLTRVDAYFSEGRLLFCIVTTDSREICIVYNEEGAPKRVLQVPI